MTDREAGRSGVTPGLRRLIGTDGGLTPGDFSGGDVAAGDAMAGQATPAATVILARDALPAGGGNTQDTPEQALQVLLLRRNSRLAFAGGMWVFPGGRVDPGDLDPGGPSDALGAARRAAVREASEEAGLVIEAATLVALSHWTPPPTSPRRFATWFFIAPTSSSTVMVDGGEIRDHRWVSPSDALAQRDAGEIELSPPTWITLARLCRYPSAGAAIAAATASEPEIFETRIAAVDGGLVALYEGDAGYVDGDPGRDGPRHRLVMAERWSYSRPDGTTILAPLPAGSGPSWPTGLAWTPPPLGGERGEGEA